MLCRYADLKAAPVGFLTLVVAIEGQQLHVAELHLEKLVISILERGFGKERGGPLVRSHRCHNIILSPTAPSSVRLDKNKTKQRMKNNI